MNIYKIVLFLFVILIFTQGCTYKSLSVKPEKSEVNNTSEISSNVILDDMIIYKVTEDVFERFIENVDINILENESVNMYTYSETDPWYITWNANRFLVDDLLMDFVCEHSMVEEYLSANGIIETVEALAVFEAPYVPITICVKTNSNNYFITINEELKDKSYTYRMYDDISYYEKYSGKEADLIINGDKINADYVSVYYNYACIPLVPVIKSFGADVTWQSDTNAEILINGESYYLDITVPTLYKQGEKNNNLLYCIDGGPTIIFDSNKELIVDQYVLRSVLYDLGEDVIIKRNFNSSIIEINNRTP